MRLIFASLIASLSIALFAATPMWKSVPSSLGDASMGYSTSGLVTNYFIASVKIPEGEHDAITIVGWYGHSATNDYLFMVNPVLTYTPVAVQLSNPDLLGGAWGDGVEGGTNLTTSFSSTNITFSTYTNAIAAAAWPHGVWTVAGWTSNACTLNLSGIDYTLGPGAFNRNLIAGGSHDCILTGDGLVSIGIAQTPCHEFFISKENVTGDGKKPKTIILSTNGISFYSMRIKLDGSNHVSDFDVRGMSNDWIRANSETNSCGSRFSSRGVYQLMMDSWNNHTTKYETIFDYRVYGYRLSDDQLDRIYQNGRDEVIRRGLNLAQTPPEPPTEPVEITFDYNYFAGNMQATLEFASSNYVAGGAFGVLPSVSSLSPRFTFNNWQDESTTVYTNESIVPSTPMTLHAAFTDLGESSYSLTFDNQGGSGSTPTIPLWDGWPFWTGDYGYPDYFPGDPTYSGYAFGGWWTQTGGSGTRVYFNDTYYYSTFHGSVTLYAYWIQLATVNFDVSYFDPNMQASLSFNTIGVLPGTALGSLPTCTSGPRYSFNNWQDSSYTVYDASTTIYSSVDLHASFTDAGASSYSLSFDLQGAYGEISSIPLWDGWAMKSGDYGDANFQTSWMRTNYRFGGWFTGTGGSGTQINGTDIYYYNTYYGSLAVYAYWIALTLSFDLQGGTGDTPTIPLNDGGIWSLDGSFPSDPTLSGYTFGGWFTGTNGTGTQIFDYDTYYYDTYGATVTVYAYWY